MRNEDKTYGIQVVSQRTGLTGHVIRAWERRYGVVEPDRTETNRRRYSEADIARLSLLNVATHHGYAISNIAKLSMGDLEKLELLKADDSRELKSAPFGAVADESAVEFLARCKESILEMNAVKLEASLLNSERALGLPVVLESVVAPLLSWAGDSWNRGTLHIAQEHLMTEIIRHFLSGLRARRNLSASAPRIVVATPPGQHHEMGAMLAAAMASMQGWNVIYLGVNLPPSDIAYAVGISGASCVALSIVYPADDPFLARELLLLRECLPRETAIIVGGGACCGYDDVLRQLGAVVHADFRDFQGTLATIRTQRSQRSNPFPPKANDEGDRSPAGSTDDPFIKEDL